MAIEAFGNNVGVTVPEPGTAVLASGLLTCALFQRRRRRG
jgi:hypothetical protein